MGQIALLDSSVWAANFLETDRFNSAADKLIVRLMADQTTIWVPEIIRAEVLNVVLHKSLDQNQVEFVDGRFRALAPAVQLRYSDIGFWNRFVPAQLSRLFLKTMDFLVACYTLYWEVEAFYSFDEKLNKALRRVKPEIAKLKIHRGGVIGA